MKYDITEANGTEKIEAANWDGVTERLKGQLIMDCGAAGTRVYDTIEDLRIYFPDAEYDSVPTKTTFKCTINDYSADIVAATASEAARKCVEKRIKEHSWFANQSPEFCEVDVDGVTFSPKSVSDSDNTWDFL